MNLKAITSALLMTALAAPSAFASTGTITFNGGITSVSCSVDGKDPGAGPIDKTVTMPWVADTQLNGAGKTAGKTGFKFEIGKDGETGCTNGTKVYAHFEPGPTTNPTTGNLRVARSGANVEIQLIDGDDNPIHIYEDQGQYHEIVAGNKATLAYAAQYYATGAATSGAANSSVTYTISFEI